MIVTTTCGYCQRAFTRRAGCELEADAAGTLCCDDCYDPDTREGRNLSPVLLSVEQAVTVHNAMWLRAMTAIDAARSAHDDVTYLRNMQVIRSSADMLKVLQPGLPQRLGGTHTAWFAGELEKFISDLEEIGREYSWIDPVSA